MRLPEQVSPHEAEAVWNSIKDPSARRVAAALGQSGRPVHHATISRWRKNRWKPVQHGPHPIETARRALDVAAPVLTGNAAGGVAAFLEQQRPREELERLTDRELVRQAARKMCIIVILLCDEFLSQMANLLPTRIREVSTLLNAIAAALRAATNSFVQAEAMSEKASLSAEATQANRE